MFTKNPPAKCILKQLNKIHAFLKPISITSLQQQPLTYTKFFF
jgi:hypothetical protein